MLWVTDWLEEGIIMDVLQWDEVLLTHFTVYKQTGEQVIIINNYLPKWSWLVVDIVMAIV